MQGLACKGPGWLTFITMMSFYDPYHGLPWWGSLEVKYFFGVCVCVFDTVLVSFGLVFFSLIPLLA